MTAKQLLIRTAVFLTVGGTMMFAQQKPAAEKIINGPRVEQVTDSGATIAWTTNTGGSSVIRYGTAANHLDQTARSPYADNESAKSQTHRVQLKGLKPNTTYFYEVVSGQGEGTGTTAQSQVAQFKTSGQEHGEAKRAAEKIIDGPRIEQVTNNSATIAWTTNTGGSSVVKYGTAPTHLDQTAQSPYADKENASSQTHRVQLKSLKPATEYYFAVVSGQGEGTGTAAQSQVSQFKTK